MVEKSARHCHWILEKNLYINILNRILTCTFFLILLLSISLFYGNKSIMTSESRYHKNYSVSFSVPDDRQHHQRTFSFPESDWTYEPTISTISPTALPMVKTLRSIKTFKRSWDPDKAIKCTYKGLFGKYQLRAYLFLALGYGIVAAWLTEMPTFALLPPKYVDCTPYYPNLPNQSLTESNETTSRVLENNFPRIDINGQIRKIEPIYNYSKEYGRSILTDFNALCDKTRVKIPYVAYILGLILGGLIFGYMADYSGRKMILLGSMWTGCVLSIFQLLSDDYISYVFFIFFLGMAIGAVHVIAIPYVMEMFPIESRAIYALSLIGIVFLLNLIHPWLAFSIKNWKILQGIISIPLIITAALYWVTEESMFWYTTKKDYLSAVLSLKKIALFNGIIFEEVFRQARDFLRGKHSIGIQCDFQPLLRLEDIKTLGNKYPDFDMVDLQATTGKKTSFSRRALQVITGHHYYPTLSTFYPTDILHSPILSIYLVIMCGLWFVSSLTEYSLDAPHITRHLTENFFFNYFYTHLIQIISFIIALPLIYKWGRRWPTFCFFLIAEVCLLGSLAVKLDEEQTRSAMLVVYFIGKFATRAAFLVIIIYTCEIFPTGLRCTTLGICYTFRLIGFALASPDVGELNDWMPRLIYGILSLILGALALLLPETKTFPLPRTMIQVELIPTSISETFRRQRSVFVKRNIQANSTRDQGLNNDVGSVLSGVRSGRPFDNQSTMHSVYELQEFGQDDTVQSLSNRSSSRRMDLHNPSFYQPYSVGVINNEIIRQPQPIAEDDEDLDDDRRRSALQKRLSEQQQQLAPVQNPIGLIDDNVIILPVTTKKTIVSGHSGSDVPSQFEITAHTQAGDLSGLTSTSDETKYLNNRNENGSESPRYQRTMSQDENYFSEHC